MSDPILRILVLNSIAAMVLCGVALVASWGRVRPSVVAVCWLVALVKLVLPPMVPVPVAQRLTAVLAFLKPHGTPLLPWAPTAVSVDFEAGSDGPEDLTSPGPVPADGGLETIPKQNLELFSLRSGLLTVWCFGACLWAGMTLYRMGRFHQVVRRGQRMACGCPATVAVDAAVPPLLWAFGGRALIVVPSALWSGLTEAERAAVLAHEAAHYQRRDHWVRWVEWGVLCVCWWHPLAWWISHRLHAAEEAACDSLVVEKTGEPRVYAAALLRTTLFLDTSDELPRAATGIGSVASLKQRVDTLMKPVAFRRLTPGGALALLCVLTFSVLADPLASPPQAPSEALTAVVEESTSLKPVAEAPRAEPADEPSEIQEYSASTPRHSENDPSIGQQYLSGYIRVNEADKLREGGDPAGARRAYTEALSIFESVQSKAPEWQSTMVDFRITRIRQQLAQLAVSTATTTETTILTPLSSSPPGLNRVGLKTSVLGQPLMLAADRIDVIQPGTVPGRSSQVTFRNGHSSYSADIDSPKPGSSMITTGSIRAHWGGWDIQAEKAVLQDARLLIIGDPLLAVEAGARPPSRILKARRLSIDLKNRRIETSGGEDFLANGMWLSNPTASMELDFSLKNSQMGFAGRMKGVRRLILNLSTTQTAHERERLLQGWPSRSEWAAERDALTQPRTRDSQAPGSGVPDPSSAPDTPPRDTPPAKFPPR